MKIAVRPTSLDVAVPPHPIDGPMLAEGMAWTADQYTFRLIEDGVIVRAPEQAASAAEPAPADPAPPVLPDAPTAGRKLLGLRTDTAPLVRDATKEL